MKKQPINKWTLYKNSMLGIVIFGVCIGIFLFTLLQIATFFSPDPLEWLESIFFGIYIGIIAFSLLFSILTLSPLHGLFQLVKQEKVLNISFAEEMVKHNITKTIYQNHQWFINTNAVTVVAIRRDYIQKIHKIKDPNGKKVRLIVTLITSNGKKLKLAGSYDNIKKFENWYLQKDSISLNKQFEKN
jgi:hypothetical protein